MSEMLLERSHEDVQYVIADPEFRAFVSGGNPYPEALPDNLGVRPEVEHMFQRANVLGSAVLAQETHIVPEVEELAPAPRNNIGWVVMSGVGVANPQNNWATTFEGVVHGTTPFAYNYRISN